MNISSFRFGCQRCGNCCKNIPEGIPIFYRDVKRIAAYLNIELYNFLKQYCRLNEYKFKGKYEHFVVPVLSIKTYNSVCPFYTEKICSIHSVKPYYCESAPFISLLFQSKENLVFFRKKCEGYGKGRRYTLSEIKRRISKEETLEEEDLKKYQNGFYLLIKKTLKQEEIK